MKHVHKTFELWWQKPKKAIDREEDRSVSFLELFYDLSYVVIIAELTHSFVQHFSLPGFIGFACLFTLVWFAWVNGTFYHDVHGNNDLRTRVFTFLQMFALAGMAIFAHNALGDGYQGFALSYTIYLGILTFLWWRTGVHDPDHRPMSRPYAIGFLFTTGVFLVSAFTAPMISFFLWGAGALFSLLLPFTLSRTNKNINEKHAESARRIRPSLVERFGLLNIIVLGEILVAVVSGANHHHSMTTSLLFLVVLGLFVAIAMWWIYFDFVSHRTPIQRTGPRFAWMYLHLPLTMSITLTGAGILILLEHGALTAAQQWLLVGSVSVFLACVTLLTRTISIDPGHANIHEKGAVVIGLGGLVVLLLGFLTLTPLALLCLISLCLSAPMFTGFMLWTKKLYLDQPK